MIQSTAWAQALRNTQSPIGTIKPVSSAIGMNSPGATMVPSARRQRIKASIPLGRPLATADVEIVDLAFTQTPSRA